jgi:CRISPR system Cascade subunit CasC
MTTFIQLHLLTFAPPANLNRDDTGRPKTALVGGDLRLRLSSQSLKRAWRTSDVFATRLKDRLGKRTKRFGEDIVQSLIFNQQLAPDEALAIARRVIVAFGKPEDEKDKHLEHTKQLAFLSPQEKQAAIDLAARIAAGEKIDDKKIAAAILHRADTAADIAMFGRMFADNPDFNREAAVQVAHAITTHRVEVEDDFYTAVDDLNTREDTGAGFVGEAGFGSGLFYLYICIDTDLLVSNLAGDSSLAADAVGALVEAAATVAPAGKRASFASHLRASYLLCEKGSDQPRSLAAAFARAVPARDALAGSVQRLRELRQGFATAYGAGDVEAIEMNVAEPAASLADVLAFACDWKA